MDIYKMSKNQIYKTDPGPKITLKALCFKFSSSLKKLTA
jgi:hypothetical protein